MPTASACLERLFQRSDKPRSRKVVAGDSSLNMSRRQHGSPRRWSGLEPRRPPSADQGVNERRHLIDLIRLAGAGDQPHLFCDS